MKLVERKGQPSTERLPEARFNDIDIPELIGMCKGVMADGTVSLAEAKYIFQWLQQRPGVLGSWPADVLYQLLGKVLQDGMLSEDEQDELTQLLLEITGEPVSVLFY